MLNAPIKSVKYTLNFHDLLHGLFVAVSTVVLTSLYPIIQSGTLPTVDQWKAIALAGIGALLSYLLKNFFSASNGAILGAEPPTQS